MEGITQGLATVQASHTPAPMTSTRRMRWPASGGALTSR